MVDPIRDRLRHHYLLGYDRLKAELTRRLGSAELASDALQETWLRLDESTPAGPVDRPHAYILQIARNLALRSRMRGKRMVTLDDAAAAIEAGDETPDACRIVEARGELALLQQAMQELTPRRRDILLASRLEQVPLRELARRHGISQRMVERELKHALVHCAERVGKTVIQRFGPRRPQVSDSRVSDSKGEA